MAQNPMGLAGVHEYVPVPYEQHPQWQIIGDDSQVLEVLLPVGGDILMEPGSMMHMTTGMKGVVKAGRGAFGRACCAGQSFFRIKYKNTTEKNEVIAVTPSFNAKIIPFDLDSTRGLTIKSGAYLASFDTNLQFTYRVARPGAALCGGQGFVLNTIAGSGMVFLASGGTVLEKTLAPGELLLVDTHAVVAFENTCQYEVRTVGDLCMMCCGGEGMFNTALTGPGRVILQSMPFEKYVKNVAAAANMEGQ